MIDSLTIFDKGGLILYQHLESHVSPKLAHSQLQDFVRLLLDPTLTKKQNRISLELQNVVVEWEETKQLVVVSVSPSIGIHKSRTPLLQAVVQEFSLLVKAQPDADTYQDLFDPTWKVLESQQSSLSTTVASTNPSAPSAAPTKQRTVNKKERIWGEAKVTEQAMAELDFSKDVPSASAEQNMEVALQEARAAYLPDPTDVPAWQEDEVLVDDEAEAEATSTWGTSIQGVFSQMAGTKVLTKADLEQPLQQLQVQLEQKNVAPELCEEICQTVSQKLVGKKLQSFARVKTAVRQALEVAIAKILTPPKHRKVDVLRSVVTQREGSLFSSKSKRPYVICMVGINGVGKSTSLAKIAYYLKSNGCKPLLAACDTFRSGAVEQLNVHAKCLDVPLYSKGYAKDPSAVARAAIQQGAEEGNDVVLVDTAGRMQNNVPLMRALSKLIVDNSPDLVLFVCEALVGNDGMDQLEMFEKAFQSGGHGRQIDGICLTKYDTVGDKVGAALTLTHKTGAPIVFVGTGQKYNHLRPLSVQSVIKSLFA